MCIYYIFKDDMGFIVFKEGKLLDPSNNKNATT
jgi:hypothetical protein